MTFLNNLDTTQEIYLKLDPYSGNQVIDISENAQSILQHPVKNLKDSAPFWSLVLHPDDYLSIKILLDQLCQNKLKTFKTDVKSNPSHPKSQWFEVECKKTNNFIVGRLKEITHTYEVHNTSLVPQDDYKSLFDNLQDVYYRTSLDGQVILASPSVKKLFGIDATEVHQYNIADFYNNPEDRDIVINELMKHGAVKEYEILMKDKDHRAFWVSCNANILLNDEGEAIGVEGVARDISQRKHNESLIKRQTFYLEEAQQMARLGNWRYDVKHKKLRVADVIYDILGYNKENKLKPSQVFRLIKSSTSIHELRRYFAKLSPKRNRLSFHCEIVNHAGVHKYLNINFHAIYSDKQELKSFRGTIQDFTQLKETELKLRKSNLLLHKTNEYLDQFVHTIAHDMRAPIANLIALINLLSTEVQDNPMISQVLNSVTKLDSTLKGLVKLIDTQKLDKEEIKRIKFSDIVERVLISLQNDIKNSNAIFEFNFQVKHIDYIEPYLISIIHNLVNNAIKYRDLNKPLKIVISSRQKDGYTILSVKDNGIGIDFTDPLEFLSQTFKRHYRHKNSGLGIGLHIIKTMVQRNDGKIEVDSQVGIGSDFKINLRPYTKPTE